jgi:protein-disulfide reductase (glutathione)
MGSPWIREATFSGEPRASEQVQVIMAASGVAEAKRLACALQMALMLVLALGTARIAMAESAAGAAATAGAGGGGAEAKRDVMDDAKFYTLDTFELESEEVQAQHTEPPASERGWNSKIAWTNSLEDAKKRAAGSGRPLMVVVHNTACSACKKLQAVFAESPRRGEVEALARYFEMVNLQNAEEPIEKDYSPDGSYFPRVFFVDGASGLVRRDINNTRGPKEYAFFYSKAEDLIREMGAALRQLAPQHAAKAEEERRRIEEGFAAKDEL